MPMEYEKMTKVEEFLLVKMLCEKYAKTSQRLVNIEQVKIGESLTAKLVTFLQMYQRTTENYTLTFSENELLLLQNSIQLHNVSWTIPESNIFLHVQDFLQGFTVKTESVENNV
jgi:hypothetical protein